MAGAMNTKLVGVGIFIAIVLIAIWYYKKYDSSYTGQVSIGNTSFWAKKNSTLTATKKFTSFNYTTLTFKTAVGLIKENDTSFKNSVDVLLNNKKVGTANFGLVGNKQKITLPKSITLPPVTGAATLTFTIPNQSGRYPGVSFSYELTN
jgi:hypothetical protein